MKKLPLIIDTDPGIDDAAALALAVFSDRFDIQLITSVMGNVNVELTTANIQKLLDFYGKEIPVAAGMSRPLLREYHDASHIHGETGLGGYEFATPDGKNLLTIHAVEAMREVLERVTTPVTIMPLGPLTNIAVLLRMYPHLKDKIGQIVLMGGAMGRGNWKVYTEFNMGVDPEAAEIVLSSGIDIVMAPMDIARQARITPDTIQAMKELNRVGEMLWNLFQHYRSGDIKTEGLSVYDSLAVGYLLQPDLYQVEEVYCTVDTQSWISAGATYMDFNHLLGDQKPNVKVLTQVNPGEFNRWFLEALSQAE